MFSSPWQKNVPYPPRLSLARQSRSDTRLKTPLTAGVYTEYTSLLQDMGAAIAAAGRFWKKLYWHNAELTDTLNSTKKPKELSY